MMILLSLYDSAIGCFLIYIATLKGFAFGGGQNSDIEVTVRVRDPAEDMAQGLRQSVEWIIYLKFQNKYSSWQDSSGSPLPCGLPCEKYPKKIHIASNYVKNM